MNWVGERLRELVDNTDYNGDGDTADEIEYTFIEYEMSSCGSSVPEYDAC